MLLAYRVAVLMTDDQTFLEVMVNLVCFAIGILVGRFFWRSR
jgi:hypothetical protein